MGHVPDIIRDTCERYGEQVIGNMLAGGLAPASDDLQFLYRDDATRGLTRDWLTERAGIQDYRERWIPLRDFILEIIVIALIGWEISVSLSGERQQASDFKLQQQALTALATNTQTTATTLETLQATTEKMKDSVEQQLIPEATRSATASERSARASETSSKTAVNALHISERAYVSAVVKMDAPPKAGEKFSFTTIAHNSGKTTAVDVVVKSRSVAVSPNLSVVEVHKQAFAATISEPVSKSTLGSLQNLEQHWVAASSEVSEEAFNALKNKTSVLYVFVDLSYADAFGNQHQTQVCEYYAPDRAIMADCDSLNSAN